MPTFDTPAPISVSVDIGAGSLVRARTGFGDIRVFRAAGPDVVESPATTRTADHG